MNKMKHKIKPIIIMKNGRLPPEKQEKIKKLNIVIRPYRLQRPEDTYIHKDDTAKDYHRVILETVKHNIHQVAPNFPAKILLQRPYYQGTRTTMLNLMELTVTHEMLMEYEKRKM